MDTRPIGRDAEITKVAAFLARAPAEPAALTITGDAGIGKTLLWKYGVETARRSLRVLACRPAAAETPLAFSALDDLFGDVAEEVLPALPGPRRRALEAMLLRDASPGPPSPAAAGADPSLPQRVLSRGILDTLRVLAGSAPLVVAIDDAQWLDRPSAGVLEFCLRRLQREPISTLVAFRTCDAVPLGLDRALPPDRLDRVWLGPLGPDAIGEILQARLGAVPPRYTLTRLYEACGGNPFYAIESARALLDRPPMLRTNEPIPIPQSLRDGVQHRVRQLAPGVQRVGRLVATSPNPQERLIRAACADDESWAAIDHAVDAGLLERDGDVLRFAHPLLRSALYAEMTTAERREVHQLLAAKTSDAQERAWHLALGADRPSEKIARVLGRAAHDAASGAAPEAAAALMEQAVRLTPASRPGAARERAVQAADYQFRSGDMSRSRELIESSLAACRDGPLRTSLLLRLATLHYHLSGWPLAEQTYQQAAAEASDDPALRAHVRQEIALARLVAGDLPAASHWAKESLRSAERAAGPQPTANSLARIALFEFLMGNGVRTDLLERAEALETSVGEEPAGLLPMLDPGLVAGLVLKWCDQLDQARLKLADRYQRAVGRGDEASLPILLYHLSQLECWAGNWAAAEEYALEGCRVAEERQQQPMKPATLSSLALVRAHRGQVQDARQLAGEALALCDSTGNVPLRAQAIAVLGFVALSLDDHQGAHAHLRHLADTAAAAGLGEPSVVKFLPDEIEALIALGETDRARSFTRQLEAQGRSLGRMWAEAAGARCRAHLAAAEGDLPAAQAACDRALSVHERLPMPFEKGRTLLVRGMIERRAKQKSAARDSFTQALGTFEVLGAPLWADKVRRELSTMGARRSVDGLTQTERRIADLVAQGLTNREIATAIFVTENTVQTHVRHIFRKLSVRSRTELAARFPAVLTAAVPHWGGRASRN